ncbi:MAG: hypothetical protein AAGA50_31970, partial [Pseudomonadota bacterium]
EILDPKGGFIHNLGSGIYALMQIPMDSATVTELGPPMKDFAKAEFSYRKRMFDESCTSVFEFYGWENGEQMNTMIVYSGSQPGSDEQIACLRKHALIFMRPASVSFEHPVSQTEPIRIFKCPSRD